MDLRTDHPLWLWALLLALLALSACLGSGGNAPGPVVSSTVTPTFRAALSPAPPPTWGALPTRIPSPTPTSELTGPLLELGQAIANKDVYVAQAAWGRAYAYDPSHAVVQREGVRLALMLGDVATAEERAWTALSYDATDAELWSLLGTVLLQRGEPLLAEQAFQMAQGLDPLLAEAVFAARWQAARLAQRGDLQLALAQAYSSAHPDDLLGFYYQAAALTQSGDCETAIQLLATVLTAAPDAPAVLWYALGEAYLERGAAVESVVALEAAAGQMARGDTSLALIANPPTTVVRTRLAEAYFRAGRCAEAESIYRGLLRRAGLTATEARSLRSRAQAAIYCQTPTPTLTPWLPSERFSPTPTRRPHFGGSSLTGQ